MEGNTTTEEILDTAVEQDAGKAVAQEHQALLKQIRETIRGLYDAHGGQLHLSDILTEAGGGMHPTEFHFTITQVTLPVVQLTVGDKSFNAPIFTESRTGKRFAVGQIPWRYLGADIKVNPRHLQRPRLEKLVEAFRYKQPRFQLTQCRILPVGAESQTINVFDGSHGTAAEIIAGSDQIICKMYLPNELDDEHAFGWNIDAHSTLRQQEFRARVLMNRRAAAFRTGFLSFLRDPKYADVPHSEAGYITSQAVYNRKATLDAALDYVYSGVLDDQQEVEIENAATGQIEMQTRPACKIQRFVRRDEQQQRGGKFLGYDLLKATIFKDFVQQEASTRIVAGDEMPRDQERLNLIRLCDILTEETLDDRFGQTVVVETDDGKGHNRKRKEPTTEAVVADRIWKKGAVRIWSKHLRDAVGLILQLAAGDLKSVFQRMIPEPAWGEIRAAVRRLRNYGAWESDGVSPLLGGNVLGEIEAALNQWAAYSNQPTFNAYYLVGRSQP